MKLYAVIGSSCNYGDYKFHLHGPMFFGIFRSMAEALQEVRTEWLRVEKGVEDLASEDEERQRELLDEWGTLEFPLYYADGEDCLDIREYELEDANV